MSEKIEVGVVIKGTEKVSSDLSKVDSKAKGLGGSINMASGALDKMTGGAFSAFKSIVDGAKNAVVGMKAMRNGAKKAVGSMKALRLAALASGIGILAVGAASLATYFTSSDEGAHKLKVTLLGLKAAAKKVGGFFKGVGSYVSKVFTQGHTAAAKGYRAEMDKVKGSIREMVGKTLDLEAATYRLEAAQKSAARLDELHSLHSKKVLALAEDENKTYKERIRLTKVANDYDEETFASKKKLLEQAKDLALDKEDYNAVGAAELELQKLETTTWEMRRTNAGRVNKLRDEETEKAEEAAQRQKEAADEVTQAEKDKADAIREAEEARIKTMMESVDQGRLFVLEAKARELEALEQSFFDLEEAQLDYIDEIEANEFAFAEGELERQEAHLELMRTTFNEKKKAINEKFASAEQAEKIKLEDELFALSLTAKEREELAVQQQYDNRIAIAGDDEGLIKSATERLITDLQAIEDEAAAERVAKEEAVAKAVKQARLGIVAAGFDALKSMAKTEEGQKRLAISQILVNQGMAMSDAARIATKAALSLPQPAGMFSVPGFTASMIGMVLSTFASIKGVMNQAGAGGGSIGSGSGGGGGGGSTSLALTPSLDSFQPGTLELPAVQAYILQNNIADADALAQALQNQSSL